MSNQEKFKRFCVAWAAYLVGSFALLKGVLVPQLGDISVVVGVAVGLVAWAVGFFKWGPILGNWDTTKQKEHSA
jgi:hypothetical protein